MKSFWDCIIGVLLAFATLAIAIGVLVGVFMPRLQHPDPIFKAAAGVLLLVLGIRYALWALPARK